MHSWEYNTFSEAYPSTMRIVREGDEVAPRGVPTYELTNVSIKIDRPEFLIGTLGRNLKYAIGALEACSIVGQFNVPEEFTNRIRKFKLFERNGVQWGSYGPRIAGDLGQVVDLLRSDPSTRQAVLTIFDSRRDLNRGEPDVPCTIAVQFLLRNGALHMRTMMRSNDLWLGFPYDTIQFFALQAAVARALTIPVGQYFHNVGSLHLYKADAEAAKAVSPEFPAVFSYPIWSGYTIAEISATARNILLGYEVQNMTPFEEWLRDQLHP